MRTLYYRIYCYALLKWLVILLYLLTYIHDHELRYSSAEKCWQQIFHRYVLYVLRHSRNGAMANGWYNLVNKMFHFLVLINRINERWSCYTWASCWLWFCCWTSRTSRHHAIFLVKSHATRTSNASELFSYVMRQSRFFRTISICFQGFVFYFEMGKISPSILNSTSRRHQQICLPSQSP